MKEDEMGGTCSTDGRDDKFVQILVGKPEVKGAFERRGRMWAYIIRMDLREIGWGSVDWIYLSQDRDQWLVLVNTVMNLWVP
jgi:hypothetical protein